MDVHGGFISFTTTETGKDAQLRAAPQALLTTQGALLRDTQGQTPAGPVRAAGRTAKVSLWSWEGARQGRSGHWVLLPLEQLGQNKY